MTTKTIVIVGDNLLAKELSHSFQEIEQVRFVDPNRMDKQVDVVIETTNLDKDEKKRRMQEIEASVSPTTLILTTTLGVTATEVASWLNYPDRVIGFGTFANFKEGNLIEVALPLQANPRYVQAASVIFSLINQDIELVEDEVGFVFPRILSMIVNEAAYALTEQTAEAEAIDVAMKKGTNYPKGPLEWAERIGLDDIYAVLSGLYRELGEERYRPAPLIRKLVYAGWIGGETDKCFYHYQNRNKELSI
ncbi:3-hydroxyacyl-CoA dehydrogenase family protein [Fredinandcohnia sp. QZ13]|uniref:3-hydroxyacyl-CoA dehydrogenase family protein n=1 Tax=Fredinandcohnia sp. QZ13 TaxID=3073144 RepID=UPI0028535C04|nr:3-hydroxyacyl-CoA dehydrogenase family protein [Fredinandcohnia sp. QZ13]MDR4887658.1 3-hydroxyacyl-CoA dehydrogenase family protein [Fredinandcohnia sp. QZ13]